MDPTFIFNSLINWIVYCFPSLAQYTKYVLPVGLGFVSAIGVFTNLLPEPGHLYPVPNVTDLQTELQGSGGFILKIARFTRSLTIGVNWFVATAPYSWFYNITNTVSNLLPHFRGKTTPALTSANVPSK